MRLFACTLVALISQPAIALADCESDVRDAVAKLQTSGPFHYVTQEWNIHSLQQSAGRVIPGKAQHIESTMQNGSRGGETIYLGKQSWKNDGLGWVGPWPTSWTRDSVTPRADFKIAGGTCSAIDVSGGLRRLKEYKFSVADDRPINRTPTAVSILVDIESGLIVRYEKFNSSEFVGNMISIYRHDATIRVEPPTVDLDRRNANALAAFHKEVELTDQDCRNTVIKLLQVGREGLPFKYKIEGGLALIGISMHGTFVPPHSFHNVMEGAPRHGGGSEFVVIGSDAWARTPLHDWRKIAMPNWKETGNAWPLSAGEVRPSWYGALFIDDFLVGAVSHLDRAECPSRGEEAGAQIDYHEYDLYRDTGHGRLRVATQRMYTGPDGARPVKLETIGPQGRVVQVQTRIYMPGLVIERPSAAVK